MYSDANSTDDTYTNTHIYSYGDCYCDGYGDSYSYCDVYS
jgi:hypothetical protein